MANDAQALTLRPAAWGAEAERWLPAALASATLEDIRVQVEQGASLFHICAGDRVCGCFVLRVDQKSTGAEGVIVAAAAHLDGVDLVAACVPAIERIFQGVQRFRFHTARPGLLRKMAKLGYAPREIVSYKENA